MQFIGHGVAEGRAPALMDSLAQGRKTPFHDQPSLTIINLISIVFGPVVCVVGGLVHVRIPP